MNKINFSDTDEISHLFQEAVDKAIADKKGKVKIIPAAEILKLK